MQWRDVVGRGSEIKSGLISDHLSHQTYLDTYLPGKEFYVLVCVEQNTIYVN